MGILLQTAVFVLGLAATVFGGGPFIGLVLRAAPPIRRGQEQTAILRVGLIIGYFERFLIYVLVMSNNVSAIGFLIAAKSIMRLGEVTNRRNLQMAEYILLGTFASYGYGVGMSLLAKWVLGWLPRVPVSP